MATFRGRTGLINRTVYRYPVLWRWRVVIHRTTCRMIGHDWVGIGRNVLCDRCCWMPDETPYRRSPVSGFGRGWLSLVPFMPKR